MFGAVYGCKILEITQVSRLGEGMGDLWYIHTMQYCVDIKKSEKNFYYTVREQSARYFARLKKNRVIV